GAEHLHGAALWRPGVECSRRTQRRATGGPAARRIAGYRRRAAGVGNHRSGNRRTHSGALFEDRAVDRTIPNTYWSVTVALRRCGPYLRRNASSSQPTTAARLP